MKKKILAYALSALTCGLFTSCSDWLDINHDPNTAEKVDPGYLFNYVAVNWAGTRTGGDFYIPLSMSSQCQVDGGLDYGGWDESVYTISPYSTGNTWKHYYSVGGNNLMLAIKNAEEADVLSYAPVAKDKVDTGMTIREICDAAVRQSDNTAGNLQFTLLDGPNGFKQSLSKIGDTVSEPSRIETELNDAVPGDIRDTSTPKQLAFNLKEYVTGDILSDDKKEIFIDWMSNNATGDELIRAGVPSDWIVADKSGAGSYGTRNDIAIVTPPNKKPIFVAVLSKKAEQDAEYDNKLIADATKIIFDLIS